MRGICWYRIRYTGLTQGHTGIMLLSRLESKMAEAFDTEARTAIDSNKTMLEGGAGKRPLSGGQEYDVCNQREEEPQVLRLSICSPTNLTRTTNRSTALYRSLDQPFRQDHPPFMQTSDGCPQQASRPSTTRHLCRAGTARGRWHPFGKTRTA